MNKTSYINHLHFHFCNDCSTGRSKPLLLQLYQHSVLFALTITIELGPVSHDVDRPNERAIAHADWESNRLQGSDPATIDNFPTGWPQA